MSIPFTGLEAQATKLRKEIDTRIAKVLDHGKFIMGPEVLQLEDRLSEYCGARHAIGCANGTDALQIALMALEVGAGDRVFVPSFTYTATAEVILILGATPVFVDVDARTFNIDCDDLEARISAVKTAGHRAAAIIGVDLYGLPADWSRLNSIAEREGMGLIADSAQSFGAARSDGSRVGVLAPLTTTSFFPAKPLGCYGDGGAIFTQSDEFAAVMRSIRTHGSGSAKYETVRVGMNSRLDTLQAAILLSKIEVFADEIDRRNALAEYYTRSLADHVTTPEKPAGVISAWAQYTIRSDRRDALQAHLHAEGIPTAIYYPLPMHLQPAYRSFGEGEGSLQTSERMSDEVLSLPMNPYWEGDDADRVIDAVNSFKR